jgi:hypothetical protein
LTPRAVSSYSPEQPSGIRGWAFARQPPGLFLRVEFPPMAQPKNTGKSTKQQPAGKGQPAPKKGK